MSQSVQNGFGSLVAKVKGKESGKNLSIYLKEEFCEMCNIEKDDILEIEIKRIKKKK
jgi:hypothetical protein